MPFPEAGLVYDYMLDDGGASNTQKGDDDEEEKKPKKTVCPTISHQYVTHDVPFSQFDGLDGWMKWIHLW